MSDQIQPGPVRDLACIQEAVCIDTKKIFDSCRDKDCIEDLRVYLTVTSQAVVDGATSLKARGAELLFAYIDVEAVPFNRGFYTVDITYYYKITADAYVGTVKPIKIFGLSVFNKRVLLFGSESSAKIFTSNTFSDGLSIPTDTNLPTAVVEAVDPIVLSLKLTEVCGCCCCDTELSEIPAAVASLFEEDLVQSSGSRRVLVTLGQFSIVRLERDTQLLIPSYDYCMPQKECIDSNDDDPCELFNRIAFPVDEFFPSSTFESNEDYQSVRNCSC